MTTARNTIALGTSYAAFSAVVYAAFYSSLKFLSDKDDPVWITCVQAAVAAAILGGYLAFDALRGRRVLPGWKESMGIAVLGLIGQVGGVLTVWGMAIIGEGVTLVLQMGIMLAVSAILGQFFLGERVTLKQIVAMLIIALSVAVFSKGKSASNEASVEKTASVAVNEASKLETAAENAASVANSTSPLRDFLGIVAGVLAGAAFAILSVGIRKVVAGDTSAAATVFIINVMGPLALGPWCVYQLGLDTLLHTPPTQVWMMLAAGVLNLAAFLLVAISLGMINVVRVNVINNGLTGALTALIGICYFQEAVNRWIFLGIVLSLAGTILISLAGQSPNEVQDENHPAC